MQAYSGFMYCETSYHLDATFRFKFNPATIRKEILLEYRNLPKSLSVREPIHPIGSKKISRLPPVPAMHFAQHAGEAFHCRRCTYSYASSNANYSIHQSRRWSTVFSRMVTPGAFVLEFVCMIWITAFAILMVGRGIVTIVGDIFGRGNTRNPE